MMKGNHDEKFLRISSDIRGIWSCGVSIGETTEHCVVPSKSKCDVPDGNSLWNRLLVHELVMVRTLSGGEPSISLRGSEICSRAVRELDRDLHYGFMRLGLLIVKVSCRGS